MRSCYLAACVCVLFVSTCLAAPPEIDTSRGDAMIANYFKSETAKLSDDCLADVNTLDDWRAQRDQSRQQLLEMLGLDPLPERTDLKPTITGKTDHDEFTVERLHFQSRPGLYVTGNLYVPKEVKEPLPAILYVCGHGGVSKDGVSFGSKVHYQHHGAWFARNGYVCLTIDTLQLGEIEGIHHGTYRYDMWRWFNRGYTPAGVEAWNCVRALDYLQSRPEVDGDRLGVTGRSGGGAYSWWIAAIDERIKCAVPVAGITDLDNYVVDGCVEGHCDCMFMVNTYRWDYDKVAAMVAPRALLISNTDRDPIFPLEGVVRIHAAARKIYELHDASDKLALHITAGGHQDTQELRVHAFRWFNHHLKNDDSLLEKTAVKFFEPEQLKVFDALPADERNTKIQESFVAVAGDPAVPEDESQWEEMQTAWRKNLLEKSFRAWPDDDFKPKVTKAFSATRDGLRLDAYDFTSQQDIQLRLFVVERADIAERKLTVLNVMDDQAWLEFLATMRPAFEKELAGETLPEADQYAFKETQSMLKSFPWTMVYVAPRGVGPTAWDQSKKKQVQHRRRFYLLGQTLDGMRIWDTRQAIHAVRSIDSLHESSLWLQSWRRMAGVALYASLFEPNVARLDLHGLPTQHRDGPFVLNARRFLNVPEITAMAAENSQVVIYQSTPSDWKYPQAVVKQLGWDAKQLQIRNGIEK